MIFNGESVEAALRESELRYRALFDSIDDGFCVCQMLLDEDGKPRDYRFVEVNPTFERHTGLVSATGRTALELVPDLEPHWVEMYGKVALTGEPLRFEQRSDAMGGRWFDVYAFRFGDPRRLTIGILFSDVTARKRADQALAESEASLRNANRMKDEFLATLSHELRTPLNAVLGWAHILRSGNTTPETVARALDSIERNARAQSQLVDDLLDMSRIVSGKLHMHFERVDLAAVVTSAVEAVMAAAKTKGLVLQVTAEGGGPMEVDGDADRLRQVIWNLLSNALKFTPSGGRVDVVLRQTDAGPELVVKDTGEGIAAGFLPLVFDRFRQADATTTRHHGGLGIGLAIVRHLAEAHGGAVTAQSDGEGRGATFTVRLPSPDGSLHRRTP